MPFGHHHPEPERTYCQDCGEPLLDGAHRQSGYFHPEELLPCGGFSADLFFRRLRKKHGRAMAITLAHISRLDEILGLTNN